MGAQGFEASIWMEITAAAGDVSDWLEAAFADAKTLPDLDALHRRAARRLDALLQSLPGADSAARKALLAPITFLLDERALGLLSSESMRRELAWPLLQEALVGVEYGGDEFFRRVDVILKETHPDQLMVEINLWCLERGFLGRYAEAPDEIEAYQKALWGRLRVPPLPLSTWPSTEHTWHGGLKRWPPLKVALVLLIFAVVWQGMLIALAMRAEGP